MLPSLAKGSDGVTLHIHVVLTADPRMAGLCLADALVIVTSALDLPLRTIKCCSVVLV